MLEKLVEQGFEIEFHSHARAILGVDFPQAAEEIEDALSDFSIPIDEIMSGGGGEAQGTQRLRRSLAKRGWAKTNFVVERRINNVPRESQSHEVDHVREFADLGRIALEIEWNNKDPFFDRDLENYKRLHADGAIYVGVIITKGRSLHEGLRGAVTRFLEEREIKGFDCLSDWGYLPTPRQRSLIETRMGRAANPMSFSEAFTGIYVSDKFGEATTHWRKLEDRVHRGVGNPCPLLLIGLPLSLIQFD